MPLSAPTDDRRSSFRNAPPICLLTLALLVPPGCTRTVETRVARVTPTTPAALPTTRPAPETALYQIKYRARDDDEYHTLRGHGHVLSRGETLGFQRTADGGIVAIAGRRTFPITPPPDWRRLMWHTSFEEQTQFAIEMDGALRAAGDVALKGAAITAFGVGVGLGLSADRDDDDDWAKVQDRRQLRRRD